MYLVAIAWLYVAVMMSVAEAMHPNGTVLGAMVTFFLYGLLPTGLVLYVMGTPLRRKARLTAELESEQAARRAGAAALAEEHGRSGQPDTGSHAAGAAEAGGITTVGKPD